MKTRKPCLNAAISSSFLYIKQIYVSAVNCEQHIYRTLSEPQKKQEDDRDTMGGKGNKNYTITLLNVLLSLDVIKSGEEQVKEAE